jgi:hypothetical protein
MIGCYVNDELERTMPTLGTLPSNRLYGLRKTTKNLRTYSLRADFELGTSQIRSADQ